MFSKCNNQFCIRIWLTQWSCRGQKEGRMPWVSNARLCNERDNSRASVLPSHIRVRRKPLNMLPCFRLQPSRSTARNSYVYGLVHVCCVDLWQDLREV